MLGLEQTTNREFFCFRFFCVYLNRRQSGTYKSESHEKMRSLSLASRSGCHGVKDGKFPLHEGCSNWLFRFCRFYTG
jgi:hypothetical protein